MTMNFHGCNPPLDGVRSKASSTVAQSSALIFRFGLNCFVVARYSGRPVSEVFYGVFPHFVAHLIAIAILVIWPQIILWLPIKMGY